MSEKKNKMDSFPDYSKITVQKLSAAWLSSRKTEIAMLRLDTLHPEISGNKWFKLKYNLEAARRENKNAILTFGGAWSNHIAATAAACDLLGFESIGIIRGGEYGNAAHATGTLRQARAHGMQLHFIRREDYRRKTDPDFLNGLAEKFDSPYIIPEGGDNAWGIKGCREILSFCPSDEYTHICCAVGTGTTLTGLIDHGSEGKIVGFPVLKNAGYLKEKIGNNLSGTGNRAQWDMITDYHFGGFAKKTPALLDFIKDFWEQYRIPLDFVYTGKMMFGIIDRMKKGYFPPGSRILAIHTGGLQGNRSLPDKLNNIS